MHEIPGMYVYCIIEHNDSLYFSTQAGETFRFSPENPETTIRIGKRSNHFPLRTIAFTHDNTLYASSYESGVYEVRRDTLITLPHIWRKAWSMKLDGFDNIWLAGRQGVFRVKNDSLVKVTPLHEAYDVDFYAGRLVVGHQEGVTFFDSATGIPDTTFCKGTICWSIDIFDSLMIVGGVDICAILQGASCTVIPLTPRYTIPWASARDRKGTIYLATQKGLYAIDAKLKKAECIGYKGKCIKSVYIDSKDRLWVGKYFDPVDKK